MEMAGFSNFTYKKLQPKEGFRVVVLQPGEVSVCLNFSGDSTVQYEFV